MTDEHRGEPFDEKTALAELEQLHAAIQAARQARQQKSEEFTRLIQQFRTRPSIERQIAESHTPEPNPLTPSPLREFTAPAEASPPPRSVEAPAAQSGVAPPVPAPVPSELVSRPFQESRRRRPLAIGLIGVTGVIGVIALGATFIASRRERAVPRAPGPVVNRTATPARVQTPSPTVRPSVAPPGVAVELGTVRPVWVRVVVDGQKKVEGIVPGGQPLQFAADRSIVVRVGNGADVLVKTGATEKPFGEAGQPVTRTFVRTEDSHSTNR